MKKILLFIASSIVFIGIGFLIGKQASSQKLLPEKGFSIQLDSKKTPRIKDSEIVMPMLYQQYAAEYRALCLQSYNIARLRIDSIAKKYKGSEKLAIVTDLDETALDNSENEVYLYKDSQTYSPQQNSLWCLMAKSKAVPGSVEFFNYVDKLGERLHKPITIFYVSNRVDSTIDSTLSNMRRLGFPQMIKSQFLFAANQDSSSKEPRRASILKGNYKIALLLGDNLIDLDKCFDLSRKNGSPHPTLNDRFHNVDSLKSMFGDKYIVFPNSIYGDWEGAMYGLVWSDKLHRYKFNYGLTLHQKKDKREGLLRSW